MTKLEKVRFLAVLLHKPIQNVQFRTHVGRENVNIRLFFLQEGFFDNKNLLLPPKSQRIKIMETNFENQIRDYVSLCVSDEVKKVIENQNKEILTLGDAASFLGLSKSYLYKMTAKGEIPFYRPLGKVMYFERSALLEWIRSRPGKTQESIAAAAAQYVDRNPLNGR